MSEVRPMKFVIFGLVVVSGFILMAGHTADQITRWKTWAAAAVIWTLIFVLSNV
jgi:hypothetical protein